MTDGAFGGLYALQRDPQRRWIAAAVAAVVGLALSTVHWSGLLLGGALVGWAWPTLGRATLAGLGFGLLALVAFGLALGASGTLPAALGMGAITYVTVATALVLGALGGLSRGLAGDASVDAGDAPSDAGD